MEKVKKLVRQATLRQLQVFHTIARLGSFSKAAEILYLTQPTVSMQVKKLAEALDAPLFEQIGRKVFLTDAGQALYEASAKVLKTLDEAESGIQRMKGLNGGEVRFTVVTTAQYFIPQVMSAFGQMYPDVSLSMLVANKERLVERISANKDDFYILGQPPEGLAVTSVPLATNPLVFVCHPEHHLAKSKRLLSLKDLSSEALLMREQGSGIRTQLERVFYEAGFEPQVAMVLGGNEALRLGLLENLGLAVTARATVQRELDEGRLVELPVEGFPLRRHWYLVHVQGKQLSMAAEKLMEAIKSAGSAFDRGQKI